MPGLIFTAQANHSWLYSLPQPIAQASVHSRECAIVAAPQADRRKKDHVRKHESDGKRWYLPPTEVLTREEQQVSGAEILTYCVTSRAELDRARTVPMPDPRLWHINQPVSLSAQAQG